MKSEERLRREVFLSNLRRIHVGTDRLFKGVLWVEWGLAVALATALSRYGGVEGEGSGASAIGRVALLGVLLNAPALALLLRRPGWWLTRHVAAAVQLLWPALLAHVTGGRIEAHFHVLGSLAFLAFYRDWTVLVTAAIVAGLQHLVHGLAGPNAVGLAAPQGWSLLEQAGWLALEELVLVLGCRRSLEEMRVVADREVAVGLLTCSVEQQVEQRTAELRAAKESLEREMRTRLSMEAELRQAQKLEAVGRLASGIAHEINTPIQFVSDSLHFLRDAYEDLIRVVDGLGAVQSAVLEGAPAESAAEAAEEVKEGADLEYLLENAPGAFERSLEGLGRVATIVRSMKEFAHPDTREKVPVSLNRAIESTLAIARNEYKYVAEVFTDFGDLPAVTCHVGDINQAILNIVVNAAHAIAPVVQGTEEKGRISVKTYAERGFAVVEISDTGSGIPENIRDRIFEPFFTTKEVGKGTGQGLAIARLVVVDRHGGDLSFHSEPGRGTTFVIRLPLGDGAPATEGQAPSEAA